MGIVHLKGSMLAEYLGGRLKSRSIHRHVENCEICKARLRDDRLLHVLLGPGGPGSDGAHVDGELLAAYLDQGLDPSRMQEIDRHLAHCDRCLASYLDLRRMVDNPATGPVPPHLYAFAVDALGSHTFGTLYLSVHGNRVLAFFMAEAQYGIPAILRSDDRLPPGAAASSPGPDRSMHRVVRESGAEPYPEKFADSMGSPWSPGGGRVTGAADDGSPNRVVIPVDEDLSLEITATPGMLDVRAVDPASGEPRAGVVMRFEYGDSGGHEQVTDDEGGATGKLPPADVPARIVLPGPPSRAIDIQVS